MYKYIITFILCALMMCMGCAIRGIAVQNRQNIIEDFDPFQYGDEFAGNIPAPETSKSSGESVIKKTVVTQVINEKTVNATNSQTQETQAASSTNNFEYRVQIGIFEDRKSADKCREEALSKVNMNVYIEFEAPFYRVRVGDFKDRKEADKYVKVMQENGFKGAFWVIKNIANQ